MYVRELYLIYLWQNAHDGDKYVDSTYATQLYIDTHYNHYNCEVAQTPMTHADFYI